MKILIVDDSKIIRKILINILKERDINEDDIIEAKDGAEALEIMFQRHVGMVLLDWNMPKLNGIEFLKTIRKIDKYKKIPIIMITSEAAKYNVMEAIQAGVSEYIIKPINMAKVLEKIDKYLKIFKEDVF